tara:strand:- start:5212 stop:5598 length:387 start_codon:yes stop_codon:yes gene_type:complete
MFYEGIDYKECNGGYSLLKLRFLTTSLTGFEYEGDSYSIQRDGRIFAYCGYWYDGPSGPTIDTANSMEGSCFHDIIYDMIKKGIIPNTYWNRRKADKIFYKALRRDKMNWFRAQLWYWGVRGGGSFHV